MAFFTTFTVENRFLGRTPGVLPRPLLTRLFNNKDRDLVLYKTKMRIENKSLSNFLYFFNEIEVKHKLCETNTQYTMAYPACLCIVTDGESLFSLISNW